MCVDDDFLAKGSFDIFAPQLCRRIVGLGEDQQRQHMVHQDAELHQGGGGQAAAAAAAEVPGLDEEVHLGARAVLGEEAVQVKARRHKVIG